MTWTLVTSGKASIFSFVKVKMPKTTNAAVATSVEDAPVDRDIDEAFEHGGAARVLSNRRAVVDQPEIQVPHDGGLKFSFRQRERNL